VIRGGEIKEEIDKIVAKFKSCDTMLSVNLTHLIDDEKCCETMGQMRWTTGVHCPKCKSSEVIKRGKDETQPARQRYQTSVKLATQTLTI
jgi:transposase-like protein